MIDPTHNDMKGIARFVACTRFGLCAFLSLPLAPWLLAPGSFQHRSHTAGAPATTVSSRAELNGGQGSNGTRHSCHISMHCTALLLAGLLREGVA
jgi:hypothetical protein